MNHMDVNNIGNKSHHSCGVKTVTTSKSSYAMYVCDNKMTLLAQPNRINRPLCLNRSRKTAPRTHEKWRVVMQWDGS